MTQRLTATVDRFEEGLAVLRFNDGQELSIDRTILPAETREGSVLTLGFTTDKETESDQAQTARQLLTDILRGHK